MMPDHRWRLQLAHEKKITDLLDRWEKSNKIECLRISYEKPFESILKEYFGIAKYNRGGR